MHKRHSVIRGSDVYDDDNDDDDDDRDCVGLCEDKRNKTRSSRYNMEEGERRVKR